MTSPAEQVAAALRDSASDEILTSRRAELLREFTPEQVEKILWDWEWWARPEQLEPTDGCRIHLYLAGRGSGKTIAAAQWIRKRVNQGYGRDADKPGTFCVAGQTASMTRAVMIEGPTGILSVFPPSERPVYEPSKLRITFHTGAVADIVTADEPERAVRGFNLHSLWGDEIASWRFPQAFDNLMLSLRMSDNPRAMLTTTPRPTHLIKSLISRDGMDVHVTRSSTYANRANLPKEFLADILRQYEGTRLGRQEIHAEILDEIEGALWDWDSIEACVTGHDPERKYRRIVVAVDPSTGAGHAPDPSRKGSGSDECGVIVAALGWDGRAYVLDDRSLRAPTEAWGRALVAAYHDWGADRILTEKAFGQEELTRLVVKVAEPGLEHQVKGVPVHQGKRLRAEPVRALYERGLVSHVGHFPQLETQMTTWVPDESDFSPDRIDALCEALSELMLSGMSPTKAVAGSLAGRRIETMRR